jgi:ribonuclease HI
LIAAETEQENVISRWKDEHQDSLAYCQYYVESYVEKQTGLSAIAVVQVGQGSQISAEYEIRIPDFTDKGHADLTAIVAAINIAEDEGNQGYIIYTEAKATIRKILSLEPNLEKVNIDWALRNSESQRCLCLVRAGAQDVYQTRAKQIAPNGASESVQAVVMPSDRQYLTRRVKEWGRVQSSKERDEFIEQNGEYRHLKEKWNSKGAVNRATETTITRIRLNRSRLKDDLYRWNLSESPDCTFCPGVRESIFHYFFICPGRSEYRTDLERFFVRDDIVNPMQCILNLGSELTEEESCELQTIIECFLMETGLAYAKPN